MQWSSKNAVLPCDASSGTEEVVLLRKTTLQQMLYLHIRSNSTFNQKSTFFLSFYVTILPSTFKQEYQTFFTAVIKFGTYTYIYTQPTNIKN